MLKRISDINIIIIVVFLIYALINKIQKYLQYSVQLFVKYAAKNSHFIPNLYNNNNKFIHLLQNDVDRVLILIIKTVISLSFFRMI